MEKTKMKQNKKYLAIIPIIAIIISILAFPVSADNDGFLLLPYVSGTTKEAVIAGGDLILNDGTYNWYYATNVSNGDVYCFKVGSQAYACYKGFIPNGNILISATSENPGAGFYSTDGPGTYSPTYDCYYASNYTVIFNSVTNSILPNYNTIDEALSAFSGYDPSSSSSYDLDYSLPPGNVAFVELTSDSSNLILTTDMPTLSNLFGEAWSNVTQMYGYSNSLPSSGSSFNTSSLSTIDWSKAAPFNVVGQSKNAAKIITVSTSSTYLVIYNPLYFYVRDGGNGTESSFLDNGYIRIRLNDVSNVKVFSLTSTAQIGPNASTEDTISSTVTSSGVTQTIDPDTGLPIWTDSEGNTVEAPSIGTGNIASSGTTTFSILQQIADSISNFFQGSVGAISNLIDNGSSFMSKLGTLYSWLPAPVYTVLTSALILVITIGVIKVFL